MRKLIDFLAPLGVAVMLGAWLANRHAVVLKGGLNLYLIVGAALVLTHLLIRWEDIAHAIGGRQLRHGTNMAVLIVLVAGILGAMNYLAYRHPLKKDFTKNERFSLSDQTEKVVRGLKDDVRVVYFQPGSEARPAGAERLRQYEALSPHVKLEFVDPLAKPTRARELDVRGPWPTIVVERQDKRERINNDSEQDLTNALIKVTREGKRMLCFVQGEGERDIDDSEEAGLSGVKGALQRDHYETKKVVLAREPAVPADCTMVVLAGPRTDLLPHTAELLKAHVRGGGKLLVMQDPELEQKRPNVDGLLGAFNINAGADLVVDVSPFGQMFGASELTPIAVEYPYHEITRGFRPMTAFQEARSMTAGTASPEGVLAQEIVRTTQASWAETDLTLKAPVQPDEGKDKRGPVALAVAATVRVTASPSPSPSPFPSVDPSASPLASPSSASPPPSVAPSPSPSPSPAEEAPAKEGRIVAFGDSDFASNAMLGFQGNRDFFLNTVAWLAQDVDLISIRPREAEDQRLMLTREQQQNVALLALLVLPGLIIAAGIRAWWVRR